MYLIKEIRHTVEQRRPELLAIRQNRVAALGQHQLRTAFNPAVQIARAAKMCDSGSQHSFTSLSTSQKRPSVASALEARLPWLSMTPFGSPVVPEE